MFSFLVTRDLYTFFFFSCSTMRSYQKRVNRLNTFFFITYHLEGVLSKTRDSHQLSLMTPP